MHHTDSRDIGGRDRREVRPARPAGRRRRRRPRRHDHRGRRGQPHREPGMEAQAGTLRRWLPQGCARACAGGCAAACGHASPSSSRSSARASSPPTSTTTPAASPPTRSPAHTSATACCGRLLPVTVALIVVQEMCARMGVVTGKGLADLIREQFGVRGHLLHHGDAAVRQPRQHHRRVRRRGGRAGDLRRQQVHLDSDRGAVRLVADRLRHLPSRRERLPGRLPLLRRLHDLRLHGAPTVGRGAHAAWSSRSSTGAATTSSCSSV